MKESLVENEAWKSKFNYDYLLNIDDYWIWAWEFLRRNKKYIQSYKEYEFEKINEQKIHGVKAKKIHCDPPRLTLKSGKVESDTAWKIRIEEEYGTTAKKLSLSEFYAKRWRLREMISPKINGQNLSSNIFQIIEHPIVIPTGGNRTWVDQYFDVDKDQFSEDILCLKYPYMIGVFDASKPTNSQIIRIKDALIKYKKSKKLKYRKPKLQSITKLNYMLYLQILDADNSGTKKSDIKKVLMVDHRKFVSDDKTVASKKLSENLKAARKISDHYSVFL